MPAAASSRCRSGNLTADVDAMLAAVSPATRLMFLANPNNPTGSMLPQDEVARLRAGLPPEVLLVIDSAYAEYVTRPDYDPGIEAGRRHRQHGDDPDIFEGVRAGRDAHRLVLCAAGVVDVLNRVRGPFNVSVAAQAAAIAALAEPGWVEKGRDHNAEWRPKLAAGLQAAGIKVWPSEGNFVLADFGTPEQAEAADACLRQRGIIVRGVRGYGLPHCLRITVGMAEEVQAVIDGPDRVHAAAAPWVRRK